MQGLARQAQLQRPQYTLRTAQGRESTEMALFKIIPAKGMQYCGSHSGTCTGQDERRVHCMVHGMVHGIVY